MNDNCPKCGTALTDPDVVRCRCYESNTDWTTHVDQRSDEIVERLIAERDALKAYAEKLENAGDAIVAVGLDFTAVTRWHQAREGKP